MKTLACIVLLSLAGLWGACGALAAPALPIPLMQALRQISPGGAALSPTPGTSPAPASTAQTCAPMCVTPMRGQTPQQAIDAIEQAGHCTISTPPGTCKPATAASWSKMQLSAQGLQTLERLEGWGTQNNPAKGEIPGVCYDDSAGHGTVGYGHEYPLGKSCAWYMNHPNDPHSDQYNSFKLSPLTEGSSAAVQLLKGDVQTKAVIPIKQQVHVQLTQQQFDALVIWVFNTGAGGLSESNALKDMNACKMDSVPSDFTHFDHVTQKAKKPEPATCVPNGKGTVSCVSCGLYGRDMVSGEIWISGSYTVPRNTFPCPKGSVH